jgi:hypothetical protein
MVVIPVSFGAPPSRFRPTTKSSNMAVRLCT